MADLGILKVQVVPDMGNFQQQVTGAMAGVASSVGRVATQVGRDLVSIGSSIVVAGGIGLSAMAVAGIRMSAQLETATLQFQTLLGSADAATQKVQELFEFAKRTPFESGPVIEASRRLQVFGGAALNTEENLKRIGDAAAATSAPIEDVAFWVGRAYSQIRGGQPFGEAAMRLQELGVLTPEVRTEMENLAAAGADSTEVFGKLQGQLDQFSGAMELQANTLAGLTSTIKDQFGIGMATAFQPVFESLKDLLGILRDFGDSDAFVAVTENMAAFSRVAMQLVQPALDFLSDALGSLTTSDVDAFFREVADLMQGFADGAMRVYDTVQPLVPLLGGMGAAFLSMKASAIPLIGLLFPQVTGLTGALLGLTLGVEDNRVALQEFGQGIAGAASDALPKMQSAISTISESINVAFQGALRGIQPALEFIVRDLLPQFADVLAELAPPLADVIEELARLASGVLVSIGPALVSIARGVAGILSSGLRVFADLLGIVNDHIEIMGPLLSGLILTLAGFKLVNAITQMQMFSSLLANIQMGLAAPSAAQAGAGFFGKIAAGAEGAALGIGGLSAALSTLGVTVVATGLLAGFAAVQKRNAERAAEAKTRIAGLREEIEQFGSTIKTARGFVEDFNDSGSRYADLLPSFREIGISAQDIAIALEGGKDSQEAFIDRLNRINPQNVTQLENAFKSMVSEWERAQPTFIDRIGGAFADLAARQEEAAQKADRHTDAITRLRDVLREGADASLNLMSADRERQEGLAALVTALQETGAAIDANSGKLNLSTEAGRNASSIVEQQVRNTQDYIAALGQAGLSTDEFSTKSHEAYNTLVTQTAVGLGITEQAAADLLAQYGLIPEDIDTQAELHKDEAEADAATLTTKLLGIPGVSAPVVADILAKIEDGELTDAENRINELVTTKWQINIRVNTELPGRLPGAPNTPLAAGVQGVPMFPAENAVDATTPMLFGARATAATVTLRPRRYSNRLFDGLAQEGATVVVPQIENKVYVGSQQITDIVRQEAVVIARDRSMAYIGASG